MRFSQERVLLRRLRAVSQWLQRETQIWPRTPAQWKALEDPSFTSRYQGPADPDLEAAFWTGVASGARVHSDRMQIMSDVILQAYPEFEIEIRDPPARQTMRLVVNNTGRGPSADGGLDGVDSGFMDSTP